MNRNLLCKSLCGFAITLAVLMLPPPPTQAQMQTPPDAPSRVTIKSDVLGEERVILVRTPPGCERGGERYPVLYMTDGDAQTIGKEHHDPNTQIFKANFDRLASPATPQGSTPQ
jgi:hypothetical protein